MEDDAEVVHKILGERGDKAASLARKALLENVESEVLQEPLRYLADNKRDLLRPTLMTLACEAVGGNAEDVLDAAVAMVLECYHIGLIDDVVDETKVKHLSWTIPGRFGIYVSLMVSIIVRVKAHSALNRLSRKLDNARFGEVNRVFEDFLVRMTEGEALNFQLKREKIMDTQKLIQVFEMQSADIEACTMVGAIIGKGTEEQVEALGRYGRLLGTLLLLREDLRDALNFSVQLGNKLTRDAYPYPVLWAINHSNEARSFILNLRGRKELTPNEIKRCVQLLFESDAINNNTKLMEELSSFAIDSLTRIRDNEAKKMLERFAKVQPQMAFRVLSG